MNRNEITRLIPFGIATILVLTSIVQVMLIPNTVNTNGETVRYVVSDAVLFASVGLAIVLTLRIFRKKAWKHTFAILLALALTPLIQFSNHTFSFGIGIIQFELTALSLLIFHLAINKEILQFKSPLFTSSILEKEAQQEQLVEHYRRKFASKNKRELERIVEEKFLVPEATEAARRLLNDQ
jgi:hypothetical protein